MQPSQEIMLSRSEEVRILQPLAPKWQPALSVPFLSEFLEDYPNVKIDAYELEKEAVEMRAEALPVR